MITLTDVCCRRRLNCWGSELTDVSIVRQMPNVQVLSLSVNNITSLADFGTCKNLVELYLRENKIKDLNQLTHLQDLQHLKKLWLAGNPCAELPNYRMTVLKALPNLEMLDNIHVTPEEVVQAEDSGNDLNSPGTCHPPSSPDRRNLSPATHQQRPSQQAAPVHSEVREDIDEEESEEYDDHARASGESDYLRHGSQSHANGMQSTYGLQQDSPNSPASPQLSNGQGLGQRQQSQQRLSYPEVTPHWNGTQTTTRPPPAHLANLPTPAASMVRSASISDYALFNGSGSQQVAAAAHAANGHEASPPYVSSGGANGSKTSYQRLLPKGGKNRVS